MNKKTDRWLAYYSVLHQYKANLEKRFTSMIIQQGVVAFASATILMAIYEKIGSKPIACFLAVIAIFALCFYAVLSIRYFRQVRAVGLVMARLERNKLGFGRMTGIKRILCKGKRLSIFTRKHRVYWIVGYSIVLIVLVAATAIIAFLMPEKDRHAVKQESKVESLKGKN